MVHVDSLPQSAALAGPVERDDGHSKFGQRQKKVIELLDERIVSAREKERTAFLAFCLESEARQLTAGIRDCDALVTGHPFHSQSRVSREIVAEPVSHVATGQIERSAVRVACGVQ